MSNSLIACLALMVWIPFTLYYFRAEIKNFRLPGGVPAPPGAETLDIENCLGASRQTAVAKAAKEVPSPSPVVETVPTFTPASPTMMPSVPPTGQLPEEEQEELPFYMTSAESMEMMHADEDTWEFEKEDMRQGMIEEDRLESVERALREPFRSEEDDRHIADDLHTLQPFEVFHTLVRDARLRTQEILAKYPPPPPEPLPEEEEPLEGMDTEEEEASADGAEVPAEDGTEGEGNGGGEPFPDRINDFLDNF